MTLSNLKEEIIQKVNSTDDLELLSEISRLTEINNSFEVYELSEDQKSALNEARANYKTGNFLTDEEANKEVDSWLKK